MGRRIQASDDIGDAAWPYATMFLYGFFGRQSPGGRRYWFQSMVLGVLLGVSLVALTGEAPPLFPVQVWALVLPACALGMFAALARYLRGLDELSRSIQLKALAVGYGAAMVLGAALLGLLLSAPSGAFTGMHPLTWATPLLAAELIRCVALVVFARRFG